jgi:hypothetical protein
MACLALLGSFGSRLREGHVEFLPDEAASSVEDSASIPVVPRPVVCAGSSRLRGSEAGRQAGSTPHAGKRRHWPVGTGLGLNNSGLCHVGPVRYVPVHCYFLAMDNIFLLQHFSISISISQISA